MHSANAVVIVRRHFSKRCEVSAAIAADGIHQIAANHAGGIRQAIGEQRRLRIQQQPRGFAGARGNDERPRVNAFLATRRLVDVGDRRDLAVFADDEFAGHCAGDQREASGLLRGRNHDLARTEVRSRDASPSALRAVVAGGTSIVGLGQDRQPRRHAKNVQMVARLLDDGLSAARLGRRQEDSVGRAGNVLFRSEDSDVGLDLVVVGRDVVVADRPIVAHAVVGANFEIYRRHAQRDASPVIGAAADDARTEPAKF